MLKLEVAEIKTLLQMMEQSQILGKDAIAFGELMSKFLKELDKFPVS